MGTPTPSQRLSRLENGSTSIGSDTNNNNNSQNMRRKWTNVLPLFVGLVVLAEIAFLGKLDMAKNSDLVNSWADSFYHFTTSSWSSQGGADEYGLSFSGGGGGGGVDSGFEFDGGCEAWLEREDFVEYSRDFSKQPVVVHGSDQDFKTCDVSCKFGDGSRAKADAAFGIHDGGSSVHRSMESAQYYSENDITTARRWEGV